MTIPITVGRWTVLLAGCAVFGAGFYLGVAMMAVLRVLSEDEGARVRVALKNLVDACYAADAAGDLAGAVDGGLIDDAWEALGEKPLTNP